MKFLLNLGQTKTLLIVALVQCLVRSTYGFEDCYPALLSTSLTLKFTKNSLKLGLIFNDDGSIKRVLEKGQADSLLRLQGNGSPGQLKPFSTITKMVSEGNFTVTTEPNTNIDLFKNTKFIFDGIRQAIKRQTPLEITFSVPSAARPGQEMDFTCWMHKPYTWWATHCWEKLTFFYKNEGELWCKIHSISANREVAKQVTLAYNQDAKSRQTIEVHFINACPDCNGTGRKDDDRCQTCNGSGKGDDWHTNIENRIIILDEGNKKSFKIMKEVFEWINTCNYGQKDVVNSTLGALNKAIDFYITKPEEEKARQVACIDMPGRIMKKKAQSEAKADD